MTVQATVVRALARYVDSRLMDAEEQLAYYERTDEEPFVSSARRAVEELTPIRDALRAALGGVS